MGLTNTQLEDQIKRINQQKTGSKELACGVILHEDAVGMRAMTGIKTISRGMDWESSHVIIQPEEPLQLANRHVLYQKEIDAVKSSQQSDITDSHYKWVHKRQADELQTLLDAMDIGTLTLKQIEDMKKILDFKPD